MITKDQLLNRYIGQLKDAMEELAHGAMNTPCRDQFDHGVFVGQYRGLQEAHKLLEAILEEDDENERKS